MIAFFLKGILLGFSIAAPVGPIGLLCIQRTLAQGRVSGFVSGMGAATADGFYGAVAGFGLTAISAFLLRFSVPIRVVGACFLFYLAARTFWARPAEGSADRGFNASLWKAYASTVLLTLTNPMTILSFMAVFAGFGIVSAEGAYVKSAMLVAGVFFGSSLWWLILSSAVGLFKARLTSKSLVWINRISGSLMAALGVLSLLGLRR
ncbi:MAG TPA: LysE family transporter [Verrucomicrobiae bacterium]|nr:LysE family transporter [Verrucomicrobiae bacterium]